MRVAIVIPCLNEEHTIAKVVGDCRKFLPTATTYVFDNGSEDKTAAIAKRAGARVISSPSRGKGHVLRHAFRVVEADYVVMIDGDGTYPVKEIPRLIQLAKDNHYDMVMGSRLEQGLPQAFRPLHYAGNHFFSILVRIFFNYPICDLLTGLRVFSGSFIKNMHLVSRGFEVETELTLKAMMQNFPFVEVAIPYVERPQGSRSKLRTFRDGWIILRTIGRLWIHFKPLLFHSGIAALLALTAFFLKAPVFVAGSILFLALGFYLESRLEAERMRKRRSTTRRTRKAA